MFVYEVLPTVNVWTYFWELPWNISYFNCCGCFELLPDGWELFGNFRGTFPISTAVAVLSFARMDGNFLGTSGEHFLFQLLWLFWALPDGWELFGNFRGTFPISVAVLPFLISFSFFSFTIARLPRWGFFRVQASNENYAWWGGVGGLGWRGGQIVRYYGFLVLKKFPMRILFSADNLFVVGGTTLGRGGPWNWVGKCARMCRWWGALEGPKKADPKTTTTTTNNFSCSLWDVV